MVWEEKIIFINIIELMIKYIKFLNIIFQGCFPNIIYPIYMEYL